MAQKEHLAVLDFLKQFLGTAFMVALPVHPLLSISQYSLCWDIIQLTQNQSASISCLPRRNVRLNSMQLLFQH